MKLTQNAYLILKYIDEHLEESVSPKILASIAGYSEYHFLRIFKKYMGTTLMEYVCRRKLIKASEDIILGEKIIVVALKYGWQSHSGFTKAFKREFGFSPSLLRAMKFTMDSLGGDKMSHVFLPSTKKGSTKEELLEILQEKLENNGINEYREKLNTVYKIACVAYKDVKRYSGEEYVIHPINVSIILAELGASREVILAGMFCDVCKKGTLPLASLKSSLPRDVYDIVERVQCIDYPLYLEEDEVLLVKLAERLNNMRTIEFLEEGKRQKKAKETLELFMPLAIKLGNKKLIDEISDLCIKY